MKMKYAPPESLIPKLEDIVANADRIDEKVRGCGTFSREDDEELVRFINFESDLQSAPTMKPRRGECPTEDEGEDLGSDDYDDEIEDEEEEEEEIGMNEGLFGRAIGGSGIDKPSHNTPTYEQDFINDSMSSKGDGGRKINSITSSRSSRTPKYSLAGGAYSQARIVDQPASIFTRADMRGVTDEEEEVARLAQLCQEPMKVEIQSSGDAFVEVEERNVGDMGEDCDYDDEEDEELDEKVSVSTISLDPREVRDRVRRDQGKKWGGGKVKRNMTKGINKYGKIDRSRRGDLLG